MCAATKLVKFREPSYARCFASVAIGLGALCVAWLFMLPVIPSLMESRRTFWIPLGVSGDAGLAASAIAAPLLFREIHPKVACRAGSVRRERAAGRVPHDHLPTIA